MAQLETKLISIYQSVTDWLKYTEAKHAGILVAAAAGPASISTAIYSSPQEISASLKGSLIASLFFFLIAGAISLLSFLPRVNRSHWAGLIWEWGKVTESDNLHYFGDLSKYQPTDLANAVSTKYDLKASADALGEALDLSDQIIIISRIVRVKLRLFTIALISLLIAILIPAIPILVSFF